MKKIKEKLNQLIFGREGKKTPMDDIIFMRFVLYAIVLLVLLLIAIIFTIALHDIKFAVLPLISFLGMSFLTLNFYGLYKNGELVIVYAVCESKDDFTQGVIDKYHTLVDRKQRKYEYRLLTVSSDGKDSYIYLILPEYNRMREGASYKILFRKLNDEFTEENLITFVQLQQDVQRFDVKNGSEEEK